jgi:hypothetical protein
MAPRGRRKLEERAPASSSTALEGARPKARTTATWSESGRAFDAGPAATHDLSLSARRRVFEARDEAGRRKKDRQTGQPVCGSRNQSDRCRSAMAGEPGQAVRSARAGADGAAMATSPGPKRGIGCSFQSDSRNVANPRFGCRMQQACRLTRGENRRSREERQGRNEFRPWQV